jgi:hypothetical protein
MVYNGPVLATATAMGLYKAASISSAPLHPRIFFRFIYSLLHHITIP